MRLPLLSRTLLIVAALVAAVGIGLVAASAPSSDVATAHLSLQWAPSVDDNEWEGQGIVGHLEAYLPPQLRSPMGVAPDLAVQWIARTPRFRWDEGGGGPVIGQRVAFEATVANTGLVASGSFNYRWLLEGDEVDAGWYPGLGSGESELITWTWDWRDGPHYVELVLESDVGQHEVNSNNNSLTVRTDALSLGIWVEESFHDFAAMVVPYAGWGGASFEDWIQRQVELWNSMLAGAVHPSTPDGVIDRVRLDKVVIVPDGALNCRVERPEIDGEQDLIWGFPAAYVGDATTNCNLMPLYAQDQTLWDRDLTLLHELSHARSLPDLYGLNVRSLEMTLIGEGLSTTDTTVPVAFRPLLPELSTPVSLVIGGEIVRCASVAEHAFTACVRGADGTYARRHTPGTPVYGGGVLITDGAGNALAGSAALPARGDHFHTGPDYGTDLMNYGTAFGEYSAWMWNRIAGQRPICGNHNAPCNLGEALNSLPERTTVWIMDGEGLPVAGAQAALYRARPGTGWYARVFEATPDQVRVTDAQGQITLEATPFGDVGVVHDEGFSNAVLALRIRDERRLAVSFVDAATLNLARARDGRQHATIILEVTDWATRPTIVSTPSLPVLGDSLGGTW